MHPTITALYRYPVKSMGGHTLTATPLTLRGIPGDRCWTVKDEERGGIKGGKRFPELMGMQAVCVEEPTEAQPSPHVNITLADGTTVLSSDALAHEKLSAAIDAPVTLWPLLPADQLDHYLRGPRQPGVDFETAMREVFARTPDEPLPDLSVFPPELMQYESPPGTYFDAFSLLIMSNESLVSMQAASDAVIDVRRFRPNIVLDWGQTDDAYPEEEWAGKQARLGEALIQFEVACPRCVMTTHGFADIPQQPQVMRSLVKHNGGNLGIYASVLEGGTVRLGDSLIAA